MATTQTVATNHGFADPVAASQSIFRGVLQALSRPGKRVTLMQMPAAPAGLPRAFAAIALTLADYETPIWLDQQLAGQRDARRYLAFHTGAPITVDTGMAALALCATARTMPDFDQFAQGTQEYPDRSATIVAKVDALEGGPELVLAGPGINGCVTASPSSLPDDFRARLKRNHALFPRGIDLILVSGDHIMGLPRTVQIVE